MIRAFLAVELPESVREEVAGFQEELRRTRPDVKWVETDKLHLTLKFLGNITDDQAACLRQSLPQAAAALGRFNLTLEGIGAFPKTTFPRVLWVGTHDGKEQLMELAQRVESKCAELGFDPEKRAFSPHLTIGRVRSQEGVARLVKQMQVAEFRAASPAPVDHVTLFQSHLSPHGSTYTSLATFPLA